MLANLFTLLFCFLIPLGILVWNEKLSLAKYLSPIVWCYIIGILFGNTNIFPISESVLSTLVQITVLLAIPLFLISTNLQHLKLQAKNGLFSFISMIFCVFISSILVGILFRDTTNIHLITGMLAGISSGGTPNMASVYLALSIPQELYIAVSTVQIAVGGIFLLYISTIAPKFYTYFLPKNMASAKSFGFVSVSKNTNYKIIAKGLFSSFLVALFLASLAVLAVWSIFEAINVIALILVLTTFSFFASLNKKIRNTPFSIELGNYLLLIFSLAIGLQAKLSSIWAYGIDLFLITFLIMFSAVFLHLIVCLFLKIDSDTVIITSVAALFGPAFIAPIATAIENKGLIAFGISCGILGYAFGTYIGLAVASLLQYFVL